MSATTRPRRAGRPRSPEVDAAILDAALRLLAAEGHRARGLIRKPEQAADLEALGAVAVLGDLEADASLREAMATGGTRARLVRRVGVDAVYEVVKPLALDKERPRLLRTCDSIV